MILSWIGQVADFLKTVLVKVDPAPAEKEQSTVLATKSKALQAAKDIRAKQEKRNKEVNNG